MGFLLDQAVDQRFDSIKEQYNEKETRAYLHGFWSAIAPINDMAGAMENDRESIIRTCEFQIEFYNKLLKKIREEKDGI